MEEGFEKLAGLDQQLMAFARSRLLLFGAALLVLLGIVVVSPSRVRPPGLDIRLLSPKDAGQQGSTIMVVVSNASLCSVMYDNGPVLEVAVMRNGVWVTNVTGRSITGSTILPPGATAKPVALTDAIQLDRDLEAVKLGLSFTSFSWRSSLAWKFPQNRLLNPIASFLFGLDRSKRSQTAWSDLFTLTNGVAVRMP